MASRQVTLLTRGYLLGWLDFKYPNPLSRLREQRILNEIEKDLSKDIITLRGQVDAALMSTAVGHNRNAVDVPYNAIQTVTELALPYMSKKNKINDKKITTEELAGWSAVLAERKKALLAKKEKEVSK